MEHKNKIEILYLLIKEQPKDALKLINKTFSKSSNCIFHDFDLRLAELICHHKSNNADIIFDKLESMRRFTFRNKELRESHYNMEMFNNIRSVILNQKLKSNFLSFQDDDNVYDLRNLYAHLIKSLIDTKSYTIQNTELMKAAETSLTSYNSNHEKG